MFRSIILSIGLMLMASTVAAQKAGVGAWENPSYTILGWLEQTPALGWYYNWRPDQIRTKGRTPRSVEYVPMIHNARDVNKKLRSDLPIRALLTFNEPDGPGSHQSGLSVAEAVRLWPKLERRGLRLGSPATTREGTLGRDSWQRRFMNEVEARGLRVDFMAVHYYSTNGDVREFERWLKAVHAEYRRPIWVTEFAYVDWRRPGAASYRKNAEFAQAAIPMLEKLNFVERYAWFAANPYPWEGQVLPVNLVDNNLKPTPVGAAFERAVSLASGVELASAAD